jgi:hypothetical protein
MRTTTTPWGCDNWPTYSSTVTADSDLQRITDLSHPII